MKLNISLTASANLVALLIAANPALAPFDPSLYTFGAPTPANDPAAAQNTSVVVSGVTGNGLTGQATVTYDRLQLIDSVDAAPTTAFNVDATTTADALKAAVVAALNLIDSEVAIQGDLVAPTDGSTTSTVQLVSSGSLVYVDDSLTITLDWAQTQPVTPTPPADTDISGVITTTALAGFDKGAPDSTPAAPAPSPTPSV